MVIDNNMFGMMVIGALFLVFVATGVAYLAKLRHRIYVLEEDLEAAREEGKFDRESHRRLSGMLQQHRRFLYQTALHLLSTGGAEVASDIKKLEILAYYEQEERLDKTDNVVVNDLLGELVNCYRHQAAPGVEMEFVTHLHNHFTVHTNHRALQRALCILLDNACRYTLQGCITVDTGMYLSRQWLTITVTDTGPGIPLDSLPTLFNLCNDALHGTGMPPTGLYTCHRIVTLLGGSIIIDSDYTDGTRMVVKVRKEV